jgi:hypothetical protein
MNDVEFQMNKTIEENQAAFFDKFSRMGGAMEDIFGNSNSSS